MDAERERIQEDLRGRISGEVRCDDLFLRMYASDASIYEIRPLGVVRPRHTDDVVACVQYASEHQIPLHARGAGTGLAGESLGRGLVIDFSRYMRRILDSDGQRVRVQPGVVHGMLNQHLSSTQRHFGPDPAMSHVTTMGSVVAIDASGSHWLRYGSARRHVESMQIVLSDGSVMEVGCESLTHLGQDANDRRRDLVGQLANLISNHSELIAQRQPQSLVNRSGYQLHDVLADDHLHLARLLSGSEGTLALITELTLATQSLPVHRGAVLLLFASLDKASRAVAEITGLGASACDLMDRRHLSLARESDVRYDLLIPAAAEAVLLVEREGASALEVRSGLSEIIRRVESTLGLAFGSHLATDEEDVELYWQLARRFVPTLYRLKGSTRPLPFVEDIAVPPESLTDFLVELQNLLKRHHVIASLFGHVGHGQLHIRPFLDLANQQDVDRMHRLATELYAQVHAVGGTISGEHGDGLSRTPFLDSQYGPLCDVFREVKRIFDPPGILNPGKIVRHEPVPMNSNLRPVSYPLLDGPVAPSGVATDGTRQSPVQLQLAWSPEAMAHAARLCNGCGSCRSQLDDVRMCPINRFSPREEASPRAKANLARAILTGELEPEYLERDELRAIADLCVHCHQCRIECPAQVDVAKLMVETKAAYVRNNGLRLTDWFLTRVDALSRLASRIPRVANWAIENRTARWLMEKSLGIAQGRKLPRVATRSFPRLAARRRLTRPTRRSGPKILYFVDTYANYHDPQLAEAMVRVMEHNGVAVFVHPEVKSSAIPMISRGDLDHATKVASHNTVLLAEAVRQGHHIVASEPAATLALTYEYPQLLDDNDARLVAQNTSEACQYLWNLHREGTLRLDFKPLSTTLGYHLPCHLRALEIGTPGENLLRLIPGLVVQRLDHGCSGMAGTYGLERKNFRTSLRAGWGLISAVRDQPIQAGTTECSSCKMQMEQGTTKPTIHPIKLLALAYGLMPELESLLATPSTELVVT